MNPIKGRVLLTGCEPGLIEGHIEALGKVAFATESEQDPELAVRRLHAERFQVVVSAYPMVPGALGGLVTALRAGDSHNPAAGLILLADPASLRAAAGLVGRGVSKVLSIAEEPTVLAIVVAQMVEGAIPMVERLPLHYPVEAEIAGVAHRWTTENLSGAGMLVGADDPLSIGSVFHFVIELPEGEVEGDAKVVRQVNSGREPVAGFGARFLDFAGDGKARLLNALRGARQIDIA